MIERWWVVAVNVVVWSQVCYRVYWTIVTVVVYYSIGRWLLYVYCFWVVFGVFMSGDVVVEWYVMIG